METIIVECPVCKNSGRVSAEFIGKQMRCKCGNVILIQSKDEVCLIPPKPKEEAYPIPQYDERTSFKGDDSFDNGSIIDSVKPFLTKIWLSCRIIANKTWLWSRIIFNKYILWGVSIIYGKEAVEMLRNFKKDWIPEKDGE